jgi:hypothetical protein
MEALANGIFTESRNTRIVTPKAWRPGAKLRHWIRAYRQTAQDTTPA